MLSERTEPTLWLDFVNTEVMEDGERVDQLPDPAALWRWFSEYEVVLEAASAGRAAAVHRAALGLRAALRVQAERMAGGKGPSAAGADAVNAVFAEAPLVLRVEGRRGRYDTMRSVVGEHAGAALFPVADSFRVFLETADPDLIGRCRNPACIRFFYDATKNRSRRWCSMETCGNRAKGAAYYRRKQRRRRGRRE